MSLELAIQENTAAIKALIALLANAQNPVATSTVSTTTTVNSVAETPAEPAAPVEKPAKKAKAEKPAEPVEAEKPAAPAVSLADLQVEGKKLLDAGKQGDLKALITKLGAAKLSTLDVAKYPEALAELKKLTANL